MCHQGSRLSAIFSAFAEVWMIRPTHKGSGAWREQDEQRGDDEHPSLGVVDRNDADHEAPALPDEGPEGDDDHVPAGAVLPGGTGHCFIGWNRGTQGPRVEYSSRAGHSFKRFPHTGTRPIVGNSSPAEIELNHGHDEVDNSHRDCCSFIRVLGTTTWK